MNNIETEVYNKIKRFIIISDTHFGVRNNSDEWLDIHKTYFFKWFIPLLKDIVKPGDALIHCGDVFDSRQSINLKVLNFSMQVFEEISKILPVFIIAGNHDIYYKKTNEVNSIKVFDWLPNVKTYHKPTILKVNDNKTSVLLMPWVDDNNDEKDIVKNNVCDYLFCHTDIRGLNYNKHTQVDTGNHVSIYKDFKRVYSGHIHFSQKYKNTRMVGSPYQMTRSDIGNNKNVWSIDFTNDTEENWENLISPKFLKIKLSDIMEMEYSRVKKIFNNNFIDILVHTDWVIKFPFNTFISKFKDVNYRLINYVIYDEDSSDISEYSHGEKMDTEEIIKNHIEKLSYVDKVKDVLLKNAIKMYREELTNSNDV